MWGRMPRTGGCQCGQVRYESSGEASALYVCHCSECRKQSASAFGMSLEVRRDGLRVLSGKPRSWSRATDSGRRLKCFFCPRCGSRLWHERDPPGDTINIKAGSLDQPIDIANAVHIWTSRKLEGVIIPANARQFPKEPG
jgi:hypothetical protein